jgi:hypothetical protein
VEIGGNRESTSVAYMRAEPACPVPHSSDARLPPGRYTRD